MATNRVSKGFFIIYTVFHLVKSSNLHDLNNDEITNNQRKTVENATKYKSISKYATTYDNVDSGQRVNGSTDTSYLNEDVTSESNTVDNVNLNESRKEQILLDELVNNIEKIDKDLGNLYRSLSLNREKRDKREVSNVTVIPSNVTVTASNVTVTASNVTVTASNVTATPNTDTIIQSNVTVAQDNDKITETNITKETVIKSCLSNDTEILASKSEIEKQSGRRAVIESLNIPLETAVPDLKIKLLNYLEDTFTELQDKIKVVNVIKQMMRMENNYKIGYITANLDILSVYLRNLKMVLEVNKHVWDGSRIIDMFDKLRNSNRIITKLLHTLKMFLK